MVTCVSNPRPHVLKKIFLAGTFSLVMVVCPVMGQADFKPQSENKPVVPANRLQIGPAVLETSLGEKIPVETGFVTVPENRQKPNSSSIRLPFVRFKSTASRPGPPIFYLAGGPGSSELPDLSQTVFAPLTLALREIGDVVLFDQRGVGKAEPDLEIPGTINFPLDCDSGDPKALAALTQSASQAAEVMKKRGIDLSAYNTNESADDVNDLRVALGYDKISLWGHSYGSHLGLAVIRRHGKFLHKVILGGINGLNHRWRFPSDSQRLLELLAAKIKATPKLNQEMPDLIGELRTLLERLEQKPVQTMVTTPAGKVAVTVGASDIRIMIVLALGDIEFIKSLPLRVRELSQGKISGEAVLSQLKRRPWGTAMRYAMILASGVSKERKLLIEKELNNNKALLGDAINFPFNQEVAWKDWGIQDLGPDFRAPVQSNLPTLFLSGTLDGRTSLEDAREVAAGFSNHRFVVIENVSHSFYLATPKILETMLEFLRTGEVSATTIQVPLELRGPNESAQIEELYQLCRKDGVEAAVKRFRALTDSASTSYVSSYVLGNLGMRLLNQDKNIKAAIAICQLNVQTFPDIAFTHYSLGEAYLKADKKADARTCFQKAVNLNPFFFAALRGFARVKE